MIQVDDIFWNDNLILSLLTELPKYANAFSIGLELSKRNFKINSKLMRTIIMVLCLNIIKCR